MENQEDIKARLDLIRDMKQVKQQYEEERNMYSIMNVKYFKVNKKDFYDLFVGNLQMENDDNKVKQSFNSLIKTCELVGESTDNYVFSYDGAVRGFEKLIQYQKEKVRMLLT